MQGLTIKYFGISRYMGTFDGREEAIMANAAARGMLDPTRDAELTEEEIKSNVKLAKDAAWEAANDGASAAPPVKLTEVNSPNTAGVYKTEDGRWVRFSPLLSIVCPAAQQSFILPVNANTVS